MTKRKGWGKSERCEFPKVGKAGKVVNFTVRQHGKEAAQSCSRSKVQALSSLLSSQFPKFRFRFKFKLWDMLGLTEMTKVAEKVVHAMPCHACQSHISAQFFLSALGMLSSHPWHKLS